MPRRVFTAINFDPNIKKKLVFLQKEIEDLFSPFPGAVRVTKSENLHLTLVFAGHVGDEDLAEISFKVKEAASKHEPFLIEFEKIGYGPKGKIPPKMVWALGKKSSELASLQESIEDTGEEYNPHITLARIKKWQWQKIEPEERPEIEKDIDLKVQVSSIDIMESKLSKRGPKYTLLESHPLK